MVRYVDKAIAYLTHGSNLLLFNHVVHPEAGIQVPGGTVEPGETPLQAVAREIEEESGLTAFRVERLLGIVEGRWCAGNQLHFTRRYFFHAVLSGPAPERWRHWELLATGGGAYEFEFFWAALPHGVPPLAGKQGALLRQLPPPPYNPGVC